MSQVAVDHADLALIIALAAHAPSRIGGENVSAPGAAVTAPELTGTAQGGADMPKRTCSVPECDRPHLARGWCNVHWKRWKKHGDPLASIPVRPKGLDRCSVYGCTSTGRIISGWCSAHYQRWVKTGDAQAGVPIMRPVADHCAVNGCDAQPVARDLCNAHWKRWSTYGDPQGSAPPWPTAEERFWSKVDTDGPGGCWLWTGALNADGYGSFQVESRRSIGVHRYAYELLVGPIPAGLELDHVKAQGCRHRHCVNPAHLEPVTHEENVRRSNLP